MVWLDSTDFWSSDHALHPLAVGTAMLFTVCVYLRLSSNRTLAPLSIYDWVLNVTFGSTMSRIITQPDLTYFRGFLSLAVIAAFEYVPSRVTAAFPATSRYLKKQPLLLVFRGEYLSDVAAKNSVAQTDVWMALRTHGLARLEQCEAVILEGTGIFSVIPRIPSLKEVPEALSNVTGYVERFRDARREEEKATV